MHAQLAGDNLEALAQDNLKSFAHQNCPSPSAFSPARQII